VSSVNATNRAAVSRAYYAAFSQASDYCGSSPRPERSHDEVIGKVRSLPFEEAFERAQDLATLKKLRVKADYRRSESISRQNAERAVGDADILIQWFERLPPP